MAQHYHIQNTRGCCATETETHPKQHHITVLLTFIFHQRLRASVAERQSSWTPLSLLMIPV
ncbi:hypothetical protein fugu_008395 [Takifugu bimaculatus]|uniref:Uncharacterized protein n=1 Tax=Takifugu bimaculatus TaxID=433685 RepID=A0A4Z2B1A0_9TELE|nr:hypothetical protein fugu_008395 [Takifugu bimaculatus]